MKKTAKPFSALRLLCVLLALITTFSLAGCAELTGIYNALEDYSEYEISESSATEQLSDADGETPESSVQIDTELSDTEQSDYEESSSETSEDNKSQHEAPAIAEDGAYTTKEDVALYIHTYGHLPENFITKKEAQALGWPGGSLEPYAEGCCIGGDRFGNREELLPSADGRKYIECDIDTLGAESRGAKRIVFSNDGLIYYTEDHYETFELLYGEE